MKIDSGRVIAYGGGSGVSYVSSQAKAASLAPSIDVMPTPGDVVNLLNMPLMQLYGVQVAVSDIVSVGGLLAVFARLAFDIFTFIQHRRDRRKGNGDGV